MKHNMLTLKNIFMAVCSFVMIFCLFLSISGCSQANEEKDGSQLDENGLFVSEDMSYSELKEYYSRDKEISLNDAEGKLAQMDITGEDDATYRVAVQKVEGSEKYEPCIEFYLISSGDEDSRHIERIHGAAVTVTTDQDEAVFLGDLACWLRENNKIEYSLNGDFYEADKIKEAVVCEVEYSRTKAQLHYLTTAEVNNKDAEYIDAHEFIML